MKKRFLALILICGFWGALSCGCAVKYPPARVFKPVVENGSAVQPVETEEPMASPRPTPAPEATPPPEAEDLEFTREEAGLFWVWVNWGKSRSDYFYISGTQEYYQASWHGKYSETSCILTPFFFYQSQYQGSLCEFDGKFYYGYSLQDSKLSQQECELGNIYVGADDLKIEWEPRGGERVGEPVAKADLVDYLVYSGRQELTEEILAQYEEDEDGFLWPHGKPEATPSP